LSFQLNNVQNTATLTTYLYQAFFLTKLLWTRK